MGTWDSVYKNKGKVQKEIYPVIKRGVRLLKRSNAKRILDLGCGTGRHAIFLAKKGFEVYGIDISQSGLGIINKIKSKLKLRNITLKRADMAKIPYKNNFFDAIVCTSVINHARLNKIKKTFKEIVRVLKSKGIFILEVISPRDFTSKTGIEIEPGTRINIADWDSDVPHHFFTKSELKGFLRDFKVIRFKDITKMSERLNRIRHHYEIIAIKK